MLEEAVSVAGGHDIECRAYRFYESLAAPGRHRAQASFELGEGPLYGIEVR